jgi:hypothetical protein
MTVFADDPGSLDRLHDIMAPPPAPWWPPAPAWYVLGAIVGVLVAVAVWRAVACWLRNRYRRAGLAELAALETAAPGSHTSPALAELVKRVALAAYPRERVASLSGGAWLAFLDATGGTDDFTRGPGAALEAGYEPGAHGVSPGLVAAVRHWVKHHRAGLPC